MARGVTIHHVVEGPMAAPAVLLAHPLGVTHRLWDATAAALRDRYRVVRYDVRGHGASATPPGPYSLREMADDVRALLDSLAIRDVHFAGMSMGGCIGLAFALAHPGRVRSLVLCDTTACYGPAVAPMWDERLRVAETAGMAPELVERTMAIWFSPDFRARRPEVVDRIAAMLAACDPRGYAASIRAIGWADQRDRIAAIRVPVLVLVGENDPGTPVAMAREIAERIAGARLVVLPGGMHCAPVECTDAFHRELRAFLDGVATPAPPSS
jgi:3-oxoadipate enol-lactonase